MAPSRMASMLRAKSSGLTQTAPATRTVSCTAMAKPAPHWTIPWGSTPPLSCHQQRRANCRVLHKQIRKRERLPVQQWYLDHTRLPFGYHNHGVWHKRFGRYRWYLHRQFRQCLRLSVQQRHLDNGYNDPSGAVDTTPYGINDGGQIVESNNIGTSFLGTLSTTTFALSDFNGDGVSDVLWRNSNGSLAEWFMDGVDDLIDRNSHISGQRGVAWSFLERRRDWRLQRRRRCRHPMAQ